MLLSWLKRRRRRRILATPFPPAWESYLHSNVPQFRALLGAEQQKLRDNLRIFIAEKHWEGCRGFALTDEIRVTIAAYACLLVLGLDLDDLRAVKSVLVYEGGFRAPFREYLDSGEVVEGESDLLGQTQYGGPVAVAWDEVHAAGSADSDGVNPVLHEFAHQLDFLNGALDGTPLLHEPSQYAKWSEVMTAELVKLRSDVERGRPTLIDPYGATDEGEFFAVATECFFGSPVEMANEHPRLYDMLRTYYRQDPRPSNG